MKKKILGIILSAAGLMTLLSVVSAQTPAVDTTTNTQKNGLVTCGNPGQNACKIDDLFAVLNNFAGFILKVIFPGVFLFGIFMVAWPLINQFSSGEPNPLANAEVKKRVKYLVIGTIFTVGAFLIVKAVLSAAGYKEIDNITNPISNNATSFIMIERVYAQASCPEGQIYDAFGTCVAKATTTSNGTVSVMSLPNPLANISVQDMILGIANVFVYVILVGGILGVVRGVIYLLLTQENPANLQKGKMWILRSLIAVAIALGAQLFYSIIVNTVSSVFG